MFGDKKEVVKKETAPDPVIDPKTIPIHTMQDDLDVLEGKAELKQPASAMFENETAAAGGSGNRNVPNPATGGESPFLNVPQAAAAAPSPKPAPSNIGDFRPKETAPAAVEKEIHAAVAHNWSKISWLLVSCVAVLGLIGGGYYFYMTRYNIPPVDVQTPEEVAETVETVPEVIPEETVVPEKFSADKPNYLMIDVESSSVAEIQKIILQTAAEISQDKKTVPVEFVVVDQNNNPIALKIFSLLFKLDFSQQLLDNLTDDFSLFIFNDQGGVRVALSLTPKDLTKIVADMKTEEKVLVRTLAPLFLEETAGTAPGTFDDSREGDVDIRFVNLNVENSLSVDYWIMDGKLFLATSKNTGRAVISKMSVLGQ